jgi:NitT/TauT family transport system substrate-binding protein
MPFFSGSSLFSEVLGRRERHPGFTFYNRSVCAVATTVGRRSGFQYVNPAADRFFAPIDTAMLNSTSIGLDAPPQGGRPMNGRSLFTLCACVLLFSLANVYAQTPAKLNAGYASMSSAHLPIWMAKDAGLLSRNGLDAQIVMLTGNVPIMALVAGDTPISQIAGIGIINSALGGSDAVMIAGGTVTLDWWLMSRPEIKTPAQLKGGAVAISSFGTASDFVARFALQKIGLVPDRDVSFVQLGNPVTRQAGLESNRVQATVHVPPSTFAAQKKGFNVLADVAALGLPYQHTGVATTRKFMRERPDIVRAYIKAHVEAVHRLKTDREGGIRVLAKYMGGLKDREILEKTYDRAVADNILPRQQYPSLDGIKMILDTLAEKDPKAKAAKPQDFAEMRFIKELEDSGFISALYAAK